MQLTVTDETLTGTPLRQLAVDLPGRTVTVRDLIAARVTAEVERHNRTRRSVFSGLVRPRDAESCPNGYRMPSRRKIDAEQQVYTALDAFQKNGFLLLIDHVQATELEQEVRLGPESSVSFVPLTPLIGG